MHADLAALGHRLGGEIDTLTGPLVLAELLDALYIGTETVKTHVRRVLTKLGLRNRAQAGTYVERASSFGPGNGRSVKHASTD